MDKYEYKVRSDEIKSLTERGDYAQAVEIADSIDWRRVRSVMMLCMVSDLYKINRRYEDAKNMLLLAYEKRPGGRTILYSLCELSIKMGELVQALNYYKEFVQAAPKDTGRYILQYRLYEAQEVSLEERIGVLEELKKRDYREKWAYELAYLYHRVGLGTRCVEECDELILWFGEGKYVVKAMELKMLHEPLSAAQQDAYDRHFEEQASPAEAEAGGEENYDGEPDYAPSSALEAQDESRWMSEEESFEDGALEPVQEKKGPLHGSGQPEEIDIQVQTVDVGKYNTINLQAELAAGLQEVLGADGEVRSGAEALGTLEETSEQEISEQEPPEDEILEPEVFFGATGEMQAENLAQEDVSRIEDEPESVEVVDPAAAKQEVPCSTAASLPEEANLPVSEPAGHIQESEIAHSAQEKPLEAAVRPPKEMADVLSQEADGQIGLVLPEDASVEEQITGQMKIEDILAEWEQIKKANEEQRKEEVRKHVMDQTGPMFTEFEAHVRDGLLEQLESGMAQPENIEEPYEEPVPEEAPPEPEELYEEPVPEEAPPEAEELYEEPVPEEAPPEPEELYEEPVPEEALPEPEELYEEPVPEEAPPEPEELYEEPAPEEAPPEPEEPYEEPEPEETPSEPEETGAGAAKEGPGDELQFTEENGGQETEYEEEAAYIEKDKLDEAVYEGEAAQEAEPETSEAESKKAAAYIENDDEGAEDSFYYPEDDIQDEDIVQEIEGIREQEDAKKVPVGGKNAAAMERDKAKIRDLTREEKELFAPFIQSRRNREQLVKALDGLSMAAYTGNLIITGEEGMDTLTLAKNIMREVRMTDSNFSGKVAKVSGGGLNQKDMAQTLEQLGNGALIVQNASGMSMETAAMLHKQLQHERFGIIVVLEDTKKAMKKLFLGTPDLYGDFTARIDLEALSNDTLVSFGRQYAREKEYSIDNLGVLALHTRIEELQTIDHVVTVIEVKQIVDEAIHRASRKTLGHFFDVLLARRYDDEDMVILTEKDFVA